MSGQQREEGLPRTPSLLPQLWVDAVGDTVETQAARSSDVQSHSWRREPGSPPECGFREILRGWRSQMFSVTELEARTRKPTPECGFREILRGWRSQMFRVTELEVRTRKPTPECGFREILRGWRSSSGSRRPKGGLKAQHYIKYRLGAQIPGDHPSSV